VDGREVLEETGWRPGPIRHLVSFNPAHGISDHRFNIFVADGMISIKGAGKVEVKRKRESVRGKKRGRVK